MESARPEARSAEEGARTRHWSRLGRFLPAVVAAGGAAIASMGIDPLWAAALGGGVGFGWTARKAGRVRMLGYTVMGAALTSASIWLVRHTLGMGYPGVLRFSHSPWIAGAAVFLLTAWSTADHS